MKRRVNGFVVQNNISLGQRMDADRSGKQGEKRDSEMLGRICIAIIERSHCETHPLSFSAGIK